MLKKIRLIAENVLGDVRHLIFKIRLKYLRTLHGDNIPQEKLNFCFEDLRPEDMFIVKMLVELVELGNITKQNPAEWTLTIDLMNYDNCDEVDPHVVEELKRLLKSKTRKKDIVDELLNRIDLPEHTYRFHKAAILEWIQQG